MSGESLRAVARSAVASWPVFLSVLTLAYAVGRASFRQDTFDTRLERVELQGDAVTNEVAAFRLAIRDIENTSKSYRAVVRKVAEVQGVPVPD